MQSSSDIFSAATFSLSVGSAGPINKPSTPSTAAISSVFATACGLSLCTKRNVCEWPAPDNRRNNSPNIRHPGLLRRADSSDQSHRLRGIGIAVLFPTLVPEPLRRYRSGGNTPELSVHRGRSSSGTPSQAKCNQRRSELHASRTLGCNIGGSTCGQRHHFAVFREFCYISRQLPLM